VKGRSSHAGEYLFLRRPRGGGGESLYYLSAEKEKEKISLRFSMRWEYSAYEKRM